MIVVTDGLKTQESYHQDAATWLRVAQEETQGPSAAPAHPAERASGPLLFYPAWESLPHEAKLPHADVISERLETLVALASFPWGLGSPAPLLVTTVAALLQRTFPPSAIRARTRQLTRGDKLNPLDLVEWLEAQGYEPEAQVNHKGEIAMRGGIIDLFPLTSPWPVRLEFFGDELESLRTFDPITQISKEEIHSFTVPPGGEWGLLKQDREFNQAQSLATLLDYLPADSLFLFCEPDALDEHAARYAEQIPAGDPFFLAWADFKHRLTTDGRSVVEVTEAIGDELAGKATLEPKEVGGVAPRAPTRRLPCLQLALPSLEAFRPMVERAADPHVAEAQRREFFGQLHRWLRQGFSVHMFCNNEGERQRFEEIWKEYGLESPPNQQSPAGRRQRRDRGPALRLGNLSRGFLCAEARRVIVTDAEIFGRYKVQRPRRLKSPHAAATRSALDIDFTELEEGDYVVHLQHGIARFLGVKFVPSASPRKRSDGPAAATADGEECLVLEYAAGDDEQTPPKLYVPVTEAHLVSKYVGAGKARPALHTLGGARWTKTKAEAERAVHDLASELLSIQAARALQAGHAFDGDNSWQREFEGSFLFEETPDQFRAIAAAKADMEAPKPMDRLICGDVGYGKTEVALRGAFKAVMGGKQVAVLVPTTVLAQQHFNTFRERMADYPIRIELLSRFRTPREQKRVVRDLAAGAVDIVIGTHRLVQGDIEFKDLGLVVIDEEQRFGVLHKENFKRLRTLVDVLTLSATPIPRTLYLALTGARDMSTIETPPADRLPVETIVTAYDERVIRDAIQREMNREGQVFYLHNRVFDIEDVALRLRALVPKARILVGHGQMHADDLEQVMTTFVNGEADVLLSTTIIESGLDIPNANTIIIDRADRFGLSDLYQLRGRVGRYKHQAYAYLLVPRHARLLTDARKRISAIKQYSTLGSGFKIAMRDLEIRGAGNLLGAQQSGHITAVGFDLYCKLLKKSVSALKGEKTAPRVEVQMRLDFMTMHAAESEEALITGKTDERDVPSKGSTRAKNSGSSVPTIVQRATACIPLDYVPDTSQRVGLYRKLAGIVDHVDVERLRLEWRDRFGPLPPPVERLLQIAELRALAARRGISILETKEDKLMLTRNGEFFTPGGKFPRLTQNEPEARLEEIKLLLLSF
jgi:transcription-repair coupling factor (superfamily II helicase)